MKIYLNVWILALGIAVLSLQPAVADSWKIQTVDSAGDVGHFTSIALDASGNPHISYVDRYNGDLKYAKWTGSGWNIQTVDSGGYVGYGSSIALDSSGNPHISYYKITNGDLWYAKWTGSGWNIQTVDSGGDVGWGNSIALDSSGNPHISYYDSTNDVLKYAKWTGSGWINQTVGSTGDQPYLDSFTSLALDSYDRPHIAYYDVILTGITGVIRGNLKYAKSYGSVWDIQTVDSSQNAGWYPSIAIDSYDRPHISYYDQYEENSKGRLKYAKWTGSSWATETVDSSEDNVGRYSSLKLDTHDMPHISYTKMVYEGPYEIYWRPYALKYAKWTGNVWQIQTVDSGYVGSFSSIALDHSDNRHISYQDYNNSDLKYALSATKSVESSTGKGRVDFDTSAGTIENLVAVNVSDIPNPPPPGSNLDYGLFRFNITNIPIGGTVFLTLTFPANLPLNMRYWKYGAEPANTAPHWYYINPIINGNKLTISLTDGLRGDDDITANGRIKDDGGPAILADIQTYYRILGNDPYHVETTDLLTAADDWSYDIAVPEFGRTITTPELLSLADEWSGS